MWRRPGKGPVTTVNGLGRATGLTAQVQAFRRRAGFYRSQPDVDALVSAGANDGLDCIDEGLIDTALETRTRRDDRRLVRSAVQSISGNLIGNIDRLTGVVDEVAVLGALPLTSTPLVVSKAEQLNSRSAKTLKAMVNGVRILLPSSMPSRCGPRSPIQDLSIQCIPQARQVASWLN